MLQHHLPHQRLLPRRRHYVELDQRELSDSHIYRVVSNDGIRWNADLDMIERALQLYQDHYTSDDADRLDKDDCLAAEG